MGCLGSTSFIHTIRGSSPKCKFFRFPSSSRDLGCAYVIGLASTNSRPTQLFVLVKMEQLSFGIPPELHTFLESASSPHPLLALLPIVTLILALLLAVPSASTYEALYSDDAPLPTDVEESSAKTPGEEEPRHAALYLRRGLLVASTLLTSAVLLAVSVARIGGGGEGGWMVVFDSGVAAGAVSCGACRGGGRRCADRMRPRSS